MDTVSDVVAKHGDALRRCLHRIDVGEHDQDSTPSILQAPGDRRTAVLHAQ